MEYITQNTIEVLLGIAVLFGAYIKFKNAFADAIKEAMQPLQGSIEKLEIVLNNLCAEMERQRTTLHDLELKVRENVTNIENQHRRIKILESYHLDKGNE